MPEQQSANTLIGATLTNHATRIEMAVASLDGTIIARAHHRAAAPLMPDALVAQFMTLARDLLHAHGGTERRLAGVALALEGIWDTYTAKVVDLPPVMGWSDFPLEARLTAASGVPAQVASVPNAALLGEMIGGAGQGASSVAYINLDRAITAAFSLDGRIVHNPYVGAIGHFPLVAGGPRCACGGYGHLETIASAQALVRMMIGRLAEAPATEAAVMALTDGRAEALTAPQIWQLACGGDGVAHDLMATALDALAMALIFLLLSLDVTRIILDGALVLSGPTWLTALRERVALLAPPRRAEALAARLTPSALGASAALGGIVVLAGQPQEHTVIVP